jgi:hypothetical protein
MWHLGIVAQLCWHASMPCNLAKSPPQTHRAYACSRLDIVSSARLLRCVGAALAHCLAPCPTICLCFTRFRGTRDSSRSKHGTKPDCLVAEGCQLVRSPPGFCTRRWGTTRPCGHTRRAPSTQRQHFTQSQPAVTHTTIIDCHGFQLLNNTFPSK